MKTAFYRINVMLLVAVMSLVTMIPAFAAEQAEQTADAYVQRAADLLGALDIIDAGDSSDMSEQVTRAEFAVLLCRFTGMFSVTEGTDAHFKDVLPGLYEEPYIYTAVSAGYMQPVNSEYFYPSWAISAVDAARSLLMALGYDQFALEERSFLNLAQDLDLYDNINTAAFTRGEVYKMMYNALHAGVMNQTGFGEVPRYEQFEDINGLYKFHNIVRTRGVITGAGGVSLGSGSSSTLPADCIELDGVRFRYAGHDLSALLGRDVWLYWRDGGASDIDDVISVEIIKDNSLTLQAEDILSYKSKTYEYEDGTKTQKVDLTNPYVIYNGEEYLGAYTDAVMKPESGDVTIITGIAGAKSDLVIIRSFQDYHVKTIMSEEQIVLSHNGDRIDLGTYEEGVTYYNASGVAAKFADIAADAVISVAQSASEKKTVVYISKDVVTGQIVKRDDSTWTVDETDYEITKQLKARIAAGEEKAPDIGSGYSFYLNCNGKIASYKEQKVTGSLSEFYAVVTGASPGGGLSDKLELKVFAKTLGGFAVYPCAKKVKLNGATADREQVYEALKRDGRNGAAGAEFVAQPVKIGLNAANEIMMLHQAGSYDDGNGFFLFSGSKTQDGAWRTYRGVLHSPDAAGTDFDAVSTTKSKQVGVNDATEYIQIPYLPNGTMDTATEKAFISTYRPTGSFRFLAFKEDAEDLIAPFVIIVADAGTKLHTEETFNVQMVVSVTQVVQDEAVVTAVKTNKMTYYLDDPNIDLDNLKVYHYDGTATGETHKVIPGDLVNIAANSLGYIQAIEIVYDSADNVMMGRGGFTNYMNTDYMWFTRDGQYSLILMNLLKVEDGYVSATVAEPSEYDPAADRHYLGVVPALITLDKTRNSASVRNATASDMIGYEDSPSDWARLIISHRYAQQQGTSFLIQRD